MDYYEEFENPFSNAQPPYHYNIKRVFSRIGAGFFALMGLQQLLVVVFAILIATFFPIFMYSDWFVWILSYAPLYLVAFPIMLLILRKIPNAPPREAIYKPSVKDMVTLSVVSVGIIYPLNFFSIFLSYLVEIVKGSEVVNPLEAALMNSSPWANVLFVVLVAPIMEELMFRRILYNKLMPYGPKTYIFVSALMFALFHANLYQILYAFVLGVMFATITYYAGGSVRYAIILHMVINSIGSGISVLLLTYGTELMLEIYSFVILGVMVLGIILGIVLLRRYWHNIRLEPGAIPIQKKSQIFLNGGMIAYLVLTIGLTLYTLLLV